MTAHRFHVPAAAPGVMDLPENTRNHVTRVLRLVEGDALRVFDLGREFGATIRTIEKHRVIIEVGEAATVPPERRAPLHLLMSPLKGDLTELVIQKATELGVARISPVVFERTDTVARRDPGEARRDRWHRVATSAAEQSGRAVVPRLDDVIVLKLAAEALGAPAEGEKRIVATEPKVADADADLSAPSSIRAVVVAVGPAGGLSPGDLAILAAAGFTPERFALHTLRSETACIAALAILAQRYR